MQDIQCWRYKKKTHGLQNETKDALISIAQTNKTNDNKEIKMSENNKSGSFSKNTGWLLTIIIAVILAIIIIPKLQPPISITFRESAINSTRVFQVTNRSGDETLVMKLDVHDSKDRVEHVFKIAPGSTYEIGILETGCYFEAGDRYSFHADGYILGIDGRVP